MRLDVNLATHPYEDTQQFWIRWGSAVALVAILTGALLYSTITEWSFAEKDRTIMSQYKGQIANRDQERSRAEAVLNRPENRTTRDRSQFLNQLIERKAFSWTQVFADLEKMMPGRLHVVSIHPEVTEDNQLQIKLVVAGESPERALDLVRKMEESTRFRQPAVTAQNTQTNAQVPGDKVEFNITALYIPSAPGG